MIKKILSISILMFCIAFTANAEPQVDKEYTCRVGASWGFPGERVTFLLSDPAMAEVIRRKDGQFVVRPKRPGDFYVVAIFQDPQPVRKLFLIHAVGEEPAAEVDEKNFPAEVLRLVNIERKKHGLQPLTLANDLSEWSMKRAHEVIKYFSHTRPGGSSFDTVAPKGIYKILGENINGGANSPEKVVYEWMHSPSHRENILFPDYEKMGLAHLRQHNTKYFDYWVQWFGK